jgi:hypothetical protein
MDNVQNHCSYINVPFSQTYRSIVFHAQQPYRKRKACILMQQNCVYGHSCKFHYSCRHRPVCLCVTQLYGRCWVAILNAGGEKDIHGWGECVFAAKTDRNYRPVRITLSMAEIVRVYPSYPPTIIAIFNRSLNFCLITSAGIMQICTRMIPSQFAPIFRSENGPNTKYNSGCWSTAGTH